MPAPGKVSQPPERSSLAFGPETAGSVPGGAYGAYRSAASAGRSPTTVNSEPHSAVHASRNRFSVIALPFGGSAETEGYHSSRPPTVASAQQVRTKAARNERYARFSRRSAGDSTP